MGDYPSWGVGAETEFFSQPGPLKDAGPIWNADPNVELPSVSWTLSRTHQPGSFKSTPLTIVSFDKDAPQVWPGAWNSNVHNLGPSEMRLEATYTFPNSGMYGAFQTSRQGLPDDMWSFNDPDHLVATLRLMPGKGVG